MEERTKENATIDKIHLQADTLIDLAVADEQSNETKGGALGGRTIPNLIMADGHDF